MQVKNRRVVRIVAIILAFLMLFTLIIGLVTSTLTASGNTIANTQAQINRLREQRAAIQQSRRQTQSYINAIEFETRSATARKSILDDRIIFTQAEIEIIDEMILEYMELLVEKELEVIEAQRREAEQLELFRMRVRNMEERGVITYLEIIFSSTSFADMLARIDFVGDIMRSDEQTYQMLVAARYATEAARASLEETQRALEEQLEELLIAHEELEAQLQEAEDLISELEAQRETARALYREQAAYEAEVQREINRREQELQRLREEERRRQEAARRAQQPVPATQHVEGTGTLRWPVPGHTVVSSPFGVRRHPVSNTNRMHNGIDIVAPHGANVIASDGGVVLTSRRNSSFGNYIVISHGNGRTTLYAHLSTRLVQQGDTVEQNQVIGRIGSTGVSTGPHLHFEVSENGRRVNPLNFFRNYTRRGW